MAKLYELTQEYMELQEMMEDINEDNEQVIKDTFEGVSGEYDIKIESCCKIIKNLEAEKDAIKNECQRLSDKKKSIEGRIDYIKSMVKESMEVLELKAAGGDILKAKIQKNGGKAPIILDVDENDIPEDFQKVTYTVDKEKIRQTIEEGGPLDFAHIGERGESLRIK